MALEGSPIRFALAGAGSFGVDFAAYLAEFGRLVAVCEPHPAARNAFPARTGLTLPQFETLDQLLAEIDFDALVITASNETHRDLAVAAANAGKHVFCEKPMANTVPECWDMVRACKAAGVRLMVGHKRRLRLPGHG